MISNIMFSASQAFMKRHRVYRYIRNNRRNVVCTNSITESSASIQTGH